MPSTINADNGVSSGSAGLKSSADSSGQLHLQTNGTVALQIDTSQNVGIGGIITGSAKLAVNGPIRAYNASSGEGGQIDLMNPDFITSGLTVDVSTADVGRIFQTANNSTLAIGQLVGTGGIVTFSTAATERMRIDSSGNLGIGLTPVANNGILQLNSYGAVQALMEKATISATAATGTINYDAATQAVLYYTSNASANWTLNIRGSSGLTLNNMMQTGQSLTVAFLVTQGATAYYASALTVDGSAVTPKYQGGSAWTSGNASSIDAYVYTVVKTGSAAFTVFASQTQFK